MCILLTDCIHHIMCEVYPMPTDLLPASLSCLGHISSLARSLQSTSQSYCKLPKVSHLELEARLSLLNCQDRKIIMAGSRSQHHQHMVVSEIRDATKWLYSYINLNRDAMIIDHGLSGYHIWVSDRGCFRYRIFSGTQQMRGRGVTPMQGNIELPRWPCVAKYLHFRYWPRQLSHVLRVLWVPWTPTQPDINQTSMVAWKMGVETKQLIRSWDSR